MGQRFLLWLFRASAVPLVLAGLLFLGGWRLGKELVFSEPDFWSGSILQFLFSLGITWTAAGIIAPILLWTIRPFSASQTGGAQPATTGTTGLPSLMPLFLAVAALLVAVGSGPVLAGWSEGLALLERFELWQELETGGEGLLALIPIAAVLFVPVIGSATILSFLSGTATAFAFRDRGTRFIRIYSAWIVLHAAPALATVYSNTLLDDLAEPWLEQVRAEAEEPADPDDSIPPQARFYLEDWIPAMEARTATQARRATWISLIYAAWIPILILAARDRFTSRGGAMD
jgi:hypothetical protein